MSNVHQTAKTNTVYNSNDHNHIIEDTQNETLIVPDTIADNDTQHNDSSWQREIDRLMKKLEEPPSSIKSQTQIIETQIEEENPRLTYPSQVAKTNRIKTQLIKEMTQPERSQQKQIQTTIISVMNEIGIQTENNKNSSSSIHECCQDVSACPCVLVSKIK